MDPNNSEISNLLKLSNISSLAGRIKNDDSQAFKEFFFLMQPSIFRFLYRYLCNKQLAEDLCQETFINFWTHRQQINPSLFPKSYLYQIARNLALNHISRDHSLNESSLISNEYHSSFFNAEEEYDKHLLLDEFQSAVNQLPERCRAIFILSKYEGFEYSEIAETLDISLQTVKNQMNKAISILKMLLSSHLK